MNTAKVLGAVPLFCELDALELAALTSVATQQKLTRDQPLLVEGAPAPAVYVILSGRVAVIKRRGDVGDHICDLDGGECVGELEIIDGSLCSASVVAYGDVEVLGISKQAFEAFLTSRPATAVKILRRIVAVLSARLRQTNIRYSSLKGITEDMES